MGSDKLSRRQFIQAAGLAFSGALLLKGGLSPEFPTEQAPGGWIATMVPAGGSQGPARRLRFEMKWGIPRTVQGFNPESDPSLEAVLKTRRSAGRIPGPFRNLSPNARPIFKPIPSWNAAIEALAGLLGRTPPERTAFILGPYPDHLADLAYLIFSARRGGTVLRLADIEQAEGQTRLADAAAFAFGRYDLPVFDLKTAQVVFLFGADFREGWLPEAASVKPGAAYRVSFSDRPAEAGRCPADERIIVLPGGWASLVEALARLLETRDTDDSALAPLADCAGIPPQRLRQLASRFAAGRVSLAVPGRAVLTGPDGVTTGSRILKLNHQDGRPVGFSFPSPAPVHPGWSGLPAGLEAWAALVERMRLGEIDLLLVHNADPVGMLPAALGFEDALKRVPHRVSFSTRMDRTARYAGILLPDHHPLESWGYQKRFRGSPGTGVAAIQPIFQPAFDTRATVDVLLQALRAAGGPAAQALPYQSEREFLQQALAPLPLLDGPTGDWDAFWGKWLARGGWEPPEAA